jgi:hypothetical protein
LPTSFEIQAQFQNFELGQNRISKITFDFVKQLEKLPT